MTFEEQVARLAAHFFDLSCSHIAAPTAVLDVIAAPDGPRVGLLAAGIAMRDLLAQTPKGREALRKLGFQPVFHQVEGE